MSMNVMRHESDLSTLPSLETIIASFGLAAKKSLGQHFLLDSAVTGEIVRYAGALDCNVIEIGPGPGGLTRSLLAAGAKKLYAIEMDDRCAAALALIKEVVGGRLEILHGDALKLQLTECVPAPRKIVANLPYNAGTAMLLTWLDDIYKHEAGSYASMTLMFQKEVAQRIVAVSGSKDFGRLSVISQWLCDCRYDMELPPELFTPPPKVDSAVVTLTPRARPLVDVRKDMLEAVVAKAFGQRRKMLRSALKGLPVSAELLLQEAGIDGSLRAEQVDVETLCRLAQTCQRLATGRP